MFSWMSIGCTGLVVGMEACLCVSTVVQLCTFVEMDKYDGKDKTLVPKVIKVVQFSGKCQQKCFSLK